MEIDVDNLLARPIQSSVPTRWERKRQAAAAECQSVDALRIATERQDAGDQQMYGAMTFPPTVPFVESAFAPSSSSLSSSLSSSSSSSSPRCASSTMTATDMIVPPSSSSSSSSPSMASTSATGAPTLPPRHLLENALNGTTIVTSSTNAAAVATATIGNNNVNGSFISAPFGAPERSPFRPTQQASVHAPSTPSVSLASSTPSRVAGTHTTPSNSGFTLGSRSLSFLSAFPPPPVPSIASSSSLSTAAPTSTAAASASALSALPPPFGATSSLTGASNHGASTTSATTTTTTSFSPLTRRPSFASASPTSSAFSTSSTNGSAFSSATVNAATAGGHPIHARAQSASSLFLSSTRHRSPSHEDVTMNGAGAAVSAHAFSQSSTTDWSPRRRPFDGSTHHVSSSASAISAHALHAHLADMAISSMSDGPVVASSSSPMPSPMPSPSRMGVSCIAASLANGASVPADRFIPNRDAVNRGFSLHCMTNVSTPLSTSSNGSSISSSSSSSTVAPSSSSSSPAVAGAAGAAAALSSPSIGIHPPSVAASLSSSLSSLAASAAAGGTSSSASAAHPTSSQLFSFSTATAAAEGIPSSSSSSSTSSTSTSSSSSTSSSTSMTHRRACSTYTEEVYRADFQARLTQSFFSSEEATSKILAFKSKAPKPTEGHLNNLRVLSTQNKDASSSLSGPGTGSGANGVNGSGGGVGVGAGVGGYALLANPMKRQMRHIPSAPERVLDAPNLTDDYYLNLLDWSVNNVLAVALGNAVYLWDASSGNIELLCETSNPSDTITCVQWMQDGSHLSVATTANDVQLWSVDPKRQLRSMKGHLARVGSLAWNAHLVSSGSRDTTIFHHDVRVQQHLVRTLRGHTQEICGLKWSADGTQLASGGNDNMCMVWDLHSSDPRLTFSDASAAVKALAWCPFQANLLATGAGTADRHMRFYDTASGRLVNAIDTESQVCTIQWSKTERELVSGHGYSQNQVSVWKYPSLVKLADLCGHTSRVLHSAVSPDGTVVCTAAADETLRFWKIWDASGVRRPVFTDAFASGGSSSSSSGGSKRSKLGSTLR